MIERTPLAKVLGYVLNGVSAEEAKVDMLHHVCTNCGAMVAEGEAHGCYGPGEK